jgi:hypothetical protein
LKLVAFCPEILKDEYGHIFSVMVPSGEVTERIWLEALSCKVNNMLRKFRNPGKVAAWVCSALDCVHTDDPDELGYIIIEGNYLLREMINLYRDSPVESFPVFVSESDPDVSECAIYDNLYTWVQDMAYFMCQGANDTFYRRSTPPDEYYQLKPDKEIDPYLQLIDKNLEVKSDPKSSVDKVKLISTLYNFYYFLGYGYECVKLEIDLTLEEPGTFYESREFNNLINEFNSKHASKISYDPYVLFGSDDGKFTPIDYYLKLDFPLSRDSESQINTIMTFYRDLYSLFSDNPFGIDVPKLIVDDCPVPLGFLSHLQKEISQLRTLQIDPEII